MKTKNEQINRKSVRGPWILPTLLFITASSEIYDTPYNPASAAPVTSVTTTATATAPTSGSLASSLNPESIVQFDYLNRQIQTLEQQVESKQTLVELARREGDIKLQKQIKEYQTVDALITELHSYVGKTPYALSGSTPRAWDCSGLTLWFYENLKGITLEHSASVQASEGEVVDAPIPGDIVAFYYKNRTSAFHVGIYVGGGRFIHSKNYAADTVLETVDGFAKKNIKVAYIRY